MSGIEIALWDIVGKATGKPVHTLLGGARRERIPAYASTLMPETPEEVRRVVTAQREAGFGAVKLGWGPLGLDAELDVALVGAARARGRRRPRPHDRRRPGVDQRASRDRPMPAHAGVPPLLDRGAVLRRCLRKYRQLAEAIETPMAGGEEESTRWPYEG